MTRVLVVDDEPQIVRALTTNLRARGYEVDAASTGEDALRIVDHGPGIAIEHRERLFEPFQRLGDRSNDTGAGLGLAVARGFVEAMGGRIRMEDTPGGGLTMVIVLRGVAA